MTSGKFQYRSFRATGLIAAAALSCAGAMASDVKLTSPDGIIDFSGDFIELLDDHYVVDTTLGRLRVAIDQVDCNGDACPLLRPEDADVRFAGSQGFALGMMPLLLEGYAAHLDAEANIRPTELQGQLLADFVAGDGYGDEIGRFFVEATSSQDAFDALREGRADLGMSSRRIRPAEARGLRDLGAGLMIGPDQEHIVAIDSLVVIVHPDNPVREVTMGQLAGIFSGRITNWTELGGPDAEIRVINRDEASGTRSTFYRAVFGAETPDTDMAGQSIAENGDATARLINEDPTAIGFVSHAFQRDAKALSVINECGMATEPDAFSAKLEEYPLQRRLYIYNRSDALPEQARIFLDFVTSENADSVISKAGFIDLGIARKSQDLNGPRARMLLDPNVDAFEGGVMREMLAEMVDYDRLSTTFRFRTGSSRLDERGAIDMRRLADYLERMPQGTRVMFVGFTDDVGGFSNNRALSVSRARKVAADLQAFAGDRLNGIRFAATGFGEIAPSTCNTSEAGRAINRRVEVWIDADRQG